MTRLQFGQLCFREIPQCGQRKYAAWMLPEHFGQLAMGIAGGDERRSKSHMMTAKSINMRKPGINQPPICHPLQADPGPQNMLESPSVRNGRSPDNGSASDCCQMYDGCDHHGSPSDRSRTTVALSRQQQVKAPST